MTRQGKKKWEGKHMQKHVGWLWICGFFGLVAGANAQTASPPAAITQFDGTYALVSAMKVNETVRDRHNRERPCGDYRTREPLIIANGQTRHTDAKGREYEGK